MNAVNRSARRTGQRGVSLFGLMFWALVIGFIGYLLVRVLPKIGRAHV